MTQTVSSTEFGIAGAWLAEYTLQTLDAGVLFFDCDGRVVQWNATAARLLGVSEEQLAGRRIDDPWWGATNAEGHRLSETDNPIRCTLDSGEQVSGSIVSIRYPDGTEMWLSLTALPVFGPDRRVRGALASIVSVAGGKRVTQILATAVHCGRVAFEHSMSAHVLVDRSGRISDWNRSLCAMIDRADVELVGNSFDLICDLDLDGVWAGDVAEARFDAHVLHRDGTRIAVVGQFTVVEWPGTGRAIMLQLVDPRPFRTSTDFGTVAPDVSAARAAHPAGTARARHDTPGNGTAGNGTAGNGIAGINIAMVTTTLGGVVVECDDSAAALFGRTPETMLDQAVDDYLAFLPSDAHPRQLGQAARSATPVSFGPCSVLNLSGGSVLKELFVCRIDEGRELLLLQLVDIEVGGTVVCPPTPASLTDGLDTSN